MICGISKNIKAAELFANNIYLSIMLHTNYHDSRHDCKHCLNRDLSRPLYEIISNLDVSFYGVFFSLSER